MTYFQSILERLDFHSEKSPQALAYRFLDLSGAPLTVLSYGELRVRSLRIAASLRERVAPGERVLLLLPSGPDFVEIFFGCLYAGVIAVPAYPPRPNQNFRRLAAICADAQVGLAIAHEAELDAMHARCEADLPGTRFGWAAAQDLGHGPELIARKSPRPNGIAFLQYTSGSTSAPKGVVLRHQNIAHNQAQIQRAFGHGSSDHVMGWLPVFHDMGLIGNILQPVYLGIGCTLMPHLAFLQKPVRWLQAISRYGATTSGGPDFAYQLCVDKVKDEEMAALDLSTWRLAFCGAEVIRPETPARFARRFAPCGFGARAFFPCYGLAEATLFVTGAHVAADAPAGTWSAAALANGQAAQPLSPADGRALVPCGIPFGCELKIVDPQTRVAVQSGQVGEVWLHGDSVAAGYWNQDTATRAAFDARLAGATDERPATSTTSSMPARNRWRPTILFCTRRCSPAR